ncbi:DUF2345 domain-containing protein [Paraburkholderia bannensis]|uniref:DUF2345 domain-containing protein n=1 Tax=Paraburkholderia bannensis TaxID=765414 RepID=UPI002ABE2A71|nr:DUF2345 domain-containing protein [Paraburkholderia bannensis]
MASLFDEAGTAQEFISKLTAVPGRQAYFLDVPGTESAKDLSVVEFEATEVMGAPTVLRIVATHPQQLARADYLNLDAVFTIVPDDGVPKRISGFIDRISNVKTSRDLSQYEIVLKSHFGRLAAVHTTQIYQHQATPDIIAAILLRHGIKDHQMSFRLRNLTLTAGENVDVGAMRRFTVVAGELLSFFAHKLGIKLYAKGKIDVQAQNDELALTALKNVTVTSTEGKLILTAKDEVWIGAGGSYIKINGSSIVNATAGDILEKCASWDIDGAATGTRNAALSIEQDCDVSRRSAASRHEALVPMDA